MDSQKRKKATETQVEEQPKEGWLKRLSSGLKKTRQGFSGQLSALFLGRKTIDDELFEELETILLSADVGTDTTEAILTELTDQTKRKALKDPEALQESLKTILCNLLAPCEMPLAVEGNPFVILMVGINGAGKTTSIAKTR